MNTFLETYQKLNADNLFLLAEIYTPEIHFIDPAHELRGLAEVEAYFLRLYANLTHINFNFFHPHRSVSEGYVQWQMTFSHPQILRGKHIVVPGTTFIKFDKRDKVFFHRDYFDLGAMLYQHLPLLGPTVKMINRRLGQ